MDKHAVAYAKRRSTITIRLVTENQLDAWVRGNARDAQGVIVELVWRLVAAACTKPRERRFPLGDSIGQHGPDGMLVVDLAFEPFVPEGQSLWEIGTGLKAGDKATSDYTDLTDSIPDNVRAESSFVFVTPLSGLRDWEHTWKTDAQAAWLAERRSRGDWKGVRVIDGTRLIDWIHQFPAVELWLGGRICDLRAEKIEIPEERWSLLSSIGEPPPLPAAVFLANRGDAREKLTAILDGSSTKLKLATHFPDQAIDFACAHISTLSDERRIDAASRCIIVSDADAWNTVCTYKDKLVLIADAGLDLSGETGTKLIQTALRAGHAVVYGGPHGGIPDPASIPLAMPLVHQIQEVLVKAGYNEERARTLSQKSGGNLGSLLRCLQNLSVLPEWAEQSNAAELAIAAVLGSWTDKSTADRTVVEGLLGKAYGEWIETMREIALRSATPLIQRDGIWKFVSRYEGWYSLGPRLFDEHLDRLKATAVSVLRERDPKFELPANERYMARVRGKELANSPLLRKGVADSLALLGSRADALTSCSRGKAETTAVLAVREILADADWMQWASVDDLLPLLAEAAPEEFLCAVEKALRADPCPFDTLFAQEGEGITGGNYITGLLWALETLAWDSDLISRVLVDLGSLAVRDPGGNWANRPANSMTTILLPWLPQTCAPLAKRIAAVKVVLAEMPEVGWKLLLSLLPQGHSMSSGTRRPAWRAIIPDDWKQAVTQREYWEQVSVYSDLVIDEARKDLSKLAGLVKHLADLPEPAHEKLLLHLTSDAVVGLPEADRLPIWNELVDFVTNHRRFSDAEWALKTGQIERIASIADKLAPGSAVFRHQRLFSERDFELYEVNGSHEEQQKELDIRRQRAVEDVAAHGGVESVLTFAEATESPWRVGVAFGTVAKNDADARILPVLLGSTSKTLAHFSGGFVWGRFRSRGWQWVDGLVTEHWTPVQLGQLLSFMPFNQDTWERSKRLLGQNESEYWLKTSANPYEAQIGLEVAIDQLINYGRPFAAIRCLHGMLHNKKPLDKERAVRALLESTKSTESANSMRVYDVVELIKALQNDPNARPEDICRVEWPYIPLLERDHNASPKYLERKLAKEPGFFCEVLRLVFRSKKEEPSAREPTEQERSSGRSAFRLLNGWCIPPGLNADGTYDGLALSEWLDAVRKECIETGHLEIGMTMVGHVLIHVPADLDGLWIHRSAAAILDARDSDDMRSGFSAQLYNSRGVHWVDPKGAADRGLAVRYRTKADAVENAGFHRLAGTLRELATSYVHDAESIVARELLDD